MALQEHIQKSYTDILKEELQAIAEFACTAAGLSATKPGGISSVPTRQEVLEALKK